MMKARSYEESDGRMLRRYESNEGRHHSREIVTEMRFTILGVEGMFAIVDVDDDTCRMQSHAA